MQILYQRERILMGNLLIEMCRRAGGFVEGRNLGAKLEAMLILIAVSVGHMEGKPFSAHKLAAYLDMPRSSVIRHLEKLKRGGYVAQRGSTYALYDDKLNAIGIDDTRACIRMIRSMAEQFAQMDDESRMDNKVEHVAAF
jgi:DNA-binding transcriptional ArsR family regulator